MHTNITPFFIRTISSLHAGSGEDNGLVDLPIQRELVTGYPKIEASTLKGAIRSRVEQLAGTDTDKYTKIHLAFGYDDQSKYKDDNTPFSGEGGETNYAQFFTGALAFTDARLLFFSVRSMKGVFALVTCPFALYRFAEDLELAGDKKGLKQALDMLKIKNLKSTTDSGFCLTTDPNLQFKENETEKHKVILEEYVFEVVQEVTISRTLLECITNLGLKNLVVVDDDVFSDFTQLFTERMTRNKIDDKKGTVTDGGLFTEEYLPPEAVLYSLLMTDKPRQPETKENSAKKDLPKGFKTAHDVMTFMTTTSWNGQARKILQIGGNTTVGKGIVELHFNAGKS